VHRLLVGPVHELQRRSTRVGQIAVAPLGDRDQHGIEVEPHCRQPVFVPHPGARLTIGLPAQHPVAYQRVEAIGQHLPRDPGAYPHVVEPPDAVEHLPQHHHGPLLAQDLHRAAERAVLDRPVEGFEVRSGMHDSEAKSH
jgi:hypothetical protein